MTLNEQETVQLVHLCLDMGEQMIQAGAEVNRVEDTLTRMGKAYGALETDVFVITSSIIITMHFPNGHGIDTNPAHAQCQQCQFCASGKIECAQPHMQHISPFHRRIAA